MQAQTFGKARCYHQQGRDELRTHIGGQRQFAALRHAAFHQERRATFPLQERYACAQRFERIGERTYGALLHALAAREQCAPRLCGVKGCGKAHRRACSTHVHRAPSADFTGSQCRLHRVGVVANCRASNIPALARAGSHGIHEECAVADAFGAWQVDRAAQHGEEMKR